MREYVIYTAHDPAPAQRSVARMWKYKAAYRAEGPKTALKSAIVGLRLSAGTYLVLPAAAKKENSGKVYRVSSSEVERFKKSAARQVGKLSARYKRLLRETS